MRQTISGLVAAIAVVTASAVPAMACGGGDCSARARLAEQDMSALAEQDMSAPARRPTSLPIGDLE